ncbi:MAG: hypothetical protein QNJ97_16225 [Myxococcota bacterium]|nr:hypothetical protein [Myxococcota bacterium]
MTYLLDTGYGLATVGSTKVGGMHSGHSFHQYLAQGKTWGQAFRLWYNNYGKFDDGWFLGMGIYGDPLLKVSPRTRGELIGHQPVKKFTPEELTHLYNLLQESALDDDIQSFSDYLSVYPTHYR